MRGSPSSTGQAGAGQNGPGRPVGLAGRVRADDRASTAIGSRWYATWAAARRTSASFACASRQGRPRSNGSRSAIICCSAATTSISRWRRSSSGGWPSRVRTCGSPLPSGRRCGVCAARRRSGCSARTPPDHVPITVLGAGRSVIGAAITVDLTREDVQRTLDRIPAGHGARRRRGRRAIDARACASWDCRTKAIPRSPVISPGFLRDRPKP